MLNRDGWINRSNYKTHYFAGGVVSPAPAVVPNPSSERIPIFAASYLLQQLVVVGGRLCQTGCIRVRVASWLLVEYSDVFTANPDMVPL